MYIYLPKTTVFLTIVFLPLSPQISDDDRMSLTTAISDEDDAESGPTSVSPYKVAR